MDDFFDKPIIEQMFLSRQEEYEQSLFDNDKGDGIKSIDENIVKKENDMDEFLKPFLKDEKSIKKYYELLQKYELANSDEIDFWSLQYYKQGLIDCYKLLKELGIVPSSKQTKKVNKFYDYADDELISYIYSDKEFNGKEMKKYKMQYKEIGDKYPRVLEVYEDGNPIELSKEEMEQLIKLHDIDIEMGSLEMRIAFKKGIKEVLNK